MNQFFIEPYMFDDDTETVDDHKDIHAFKKVCSSNLRYEDNTVTYSLATADAIEREHIRDRDRTSKLRSQNYDSHQMCFFVYLLLRLDYTICIERLYKKSKKIDQIIRIKSVSKSGTNKFSEHIFSHEEYDYNGDLKRKRRNIDAVTNNRLLSMLEYEGARYDVKKCKEFKTVSLVNTEGKKRLKWIALGSHLYKKQDIDTIGKKAYMFIVEKIKKYDYTFTKNEGVAIDFI